MTSNGAELHMVVASISVFTKLYMFRKKRFSSFFLGCSQEDHGGEAPCGQGGKQGGGQAERACHEEGGQGHLRAEDAVAGPGGDLRQEGDAAH